MKFTDSDFFVNPAGDLPDLFPERKKYVPTPDYVDTRTQDEKDEAGANQADLDRACPFKHNL